MASCPFSVVDRIATSVRERILLVAVIIAECEGFAAVSIVDGKSFLHNLKRE